jgi:hypothetical protein
MFASALPHGSHGLGGESHRAGTRQEDHVPPDGFKHHTTPTFFRLLDSREHLETFDHAFPAIFLPKIGEGEAYSALPGDVVFNRLFAYGGGGQRVCM